MVRLHKNERLTSSINKRENDNRPTNLCDNDRGSVYDKIENKICRLNVGMNAATDGEAETTS